MVYGYETERRDLINSHRFDFHVLAVYLPIIVSISISMRDGEVRYFIDVVLQSLNHRRFR